MTHLFKDTADAARRNNRRQEGDNMKALYKGFIIEKDNTIDTDVYYIRREDGKMFEAPDGLKVTIDNIQGTFFEAVGYIDAITE